MTLEEKVAQMRCIWSDKGELFDDDGNVVLEKALKALPHGIGQIARPSDTMGMKEGGPRSITNCTALVNAIQRVLVERTGLVSRRYSTRKPRMAMPRGTPRCSRFRRPWAARGTLR